MPYLPHTPAPAPSPAAAPRARTMGAVLGTVRTMKGPAPAGASLTRRVAAPAAAVRSRDRVFTMPVAAEQLPSRPVGRAKLAQVRTIRRSDASLLGEYGMEGTYLGFSLGKVFKNIGRAVKKGVTDVGHTVGTVVTSKIGQAVIGTGLALTGVGIPAAAGLMAATKGVGTLIKPGGNLKGAVTGAAQGAVEGVVASAAGSAGRSLFSHLTQSQSATGPAATAAAQVTPTPVTPVAPSALPTLLPPQVATAPTADGQMPQIGQQAPAAPRVKRVRAGASGYGMPPGAARSVLKAGQQAGAASTAAAGEVDSLNKKLDAVQSALAAAQQIGDQNGIGSLSSLASSLQSQLASAQNVAGGVAGDIRMAGGAVQGASVGAVSGAGMSNLSEFISTHKALVYGGAAGVGLLMTILLTSGRRAAGAH